MKSSAIAIVGMAGRFPGARNTREFWQNLRAGVESIRDLSDAELLAVGVSAEDLASPEYVKRASVLDDVALFDAAFFGFSPRDASILDPQHRHFLECAWEAVEDAGHPPHRFDGSVGVFAGSGMNTYLIHNLLANRRLLESAGLFQLKQTGNDKDVLATRVSYQFDLRGPSINIQTACSTSLVAVHLACQSLLNFECDMALAGGVTIEIPHGQGYLYREGEILSRDGHCRSFDARSSGTVFGSGLGVVVLRRLEDALESHDNIRAVILGSAINNDGARKVGYLAPSVEGQAEVIAEALDFAGVHAGDISYVEAHGTGTTVGDPIETRALTQAFRKSTARSAYCGIGSLKSSVGHLDAAAGVAGLIKTVLALEHGQIPASLNFEKLNPHIELQGSPFYVNAALKDWTGSERRAGVTALGIGGTNAHVVLEEAPRHSLDRQPKPYQVLAVSAKTEAAAERAFAQLAAHIESHPELNLADVAFTCQLGRAAFPHRRALAVADTAEARAGLPQTDRKRIAVGQAGKTAPQVVFLFSGQGAQYADMGRELYEQEAVFREAIDLCSKHLSATLGMDLRTVLFPSPDQREAAAETLNQTWLTQPALFVVEYALARWWMALGVEPAAMVGHSIGEYVAACLAGVFSLEDALAIAAFRGRLMYDLPTGAMLAVPLAPADLHLNGTLSLAAVNAPELCVVSGPVAEIAQLEQDLARRSIACRRLHTSHAFHSAMMDPILGAFEERLRAVRFHPPLIPYLSNVTGDWIKAEEATDPAYWARHLRHTVRFADCLAELAGKPNQVLIEAGPGNTLTSLARQQGLTNAFQSLPHPRETGSALGLALQTLGQLWVSGVDVDWASLHAAGSVQRVSLPTYPFEHQRFWIEPDRVQPAALALTEQPQEEQAIELYRRVWRPAPATSASETQPACWIVFNDSLGLGDRVAAEVKRGKQQVILVEAGESFKRSKNDRYTIRPGVRSDYDALLADLAQSGFAPRNILHLWSILKDGALPSLEQTLGRSFYSPLYLAQALAAQDLAEMDIAFVSNHMQQVAAEPVFAPARAVLLGPARVIPKELPGLTCRSIDVELGASRGMNECAGHIVAEMASARFESTLAFRGGARFVERLEAFDLATARKKPRLQSKGVYLITGGLGGLGLVVAEQLAREFQAKLVLVGRSAMPPESEWEAVLMDPAQSEGLKAVLRKLIQIRAVAGGLLLAQGDVTDLAEMRDVVAQARHRFGKIDGLFHTAGVLDDMPLLLKTAESAARVLNAKVRGTLVLEEALGPEPLDCFVLFSSISSLFPPAGQVDYAAANAFLDAFALSRGERVTVVNWGAWDEVGMGARAASPHPLLQRRLLDDAHATVYTSQFSQQNQWLLSEHRFKTGRALIPGTGYLEMVAAAFSRVSNTGALQFENVFFLAPLTFDPDETREVRVQLVRHQESARNAASRFSVFARASAEQDGMWVEHCSGQIAFGATQQDFTVDRASIATRCLDREIDFDHEHRTRQERYFDFGPRWHCLRVLAIGNREGLAQLTLNPAFHADLPAYRMHPALLDLATGCALYMTDDYASSRSLYLPFSYRRLSVYRTLPLKLFSHIRAREVNQAAGEVATFDITLFDEQEQVLAEIEGFTMRRMGETVTTMGGNNAPRQPLPDQEQPIVVEEHVGIPPQEGALTLIRMLQSDAPVALVAVARGFTAAETQRTAPLPKPVADAVLTARASGATTRESVEVALAEWWQELLGVDHVGLEDDFFSLGGHSLIGVRLFAKIKKAYGVDLELAALFEARTVRQIAELIRKAQRPEGTEPKAWSALVPIQPRGSRIPLFCVHAVGGDVLFYQQLANALGPDQPFYGLQSPLASLSDIRPTSLEELAAIYVKEIRAFLPQGPYLIGGASYGGLVAFEMAKQLRAQGAEPAILVLFDTSVPNSEHAIAAEARAVDFLHSLRSQGAAYLAQKVKVKRAYWKEILIARWRVLACSFYRLAGWPLPTTLRYFYMDWSHRVALAHYKFLPYEGKITLMRAIDRGPEVLGKREDATLGWGPLAGGGLEIHDVPTEHMMMLFEPYVASFAELLKSILPS